MGADTKIEWCDHTFNPWWGCTKIAQGCTNCYAEGQSKRYGHEVWGKDAPRRFMSDNHWRQPLKWAKAQREACEAWTRQREFVKFGRHEESPQRNRPRVFCGSMCDVFEDRNDLHEPRARLFDLINETPELDWLLLTKRPQPNRVCSPDMPSNVWLGVSVATQAEADENIPLLLQWEARVRFVSYEPAIEAVNFILGRRGCSQCEEGVRRGWHYTRNPSGVGFVKREVYCPGCGFMYDRGNTLDWIIVGGESGPKARPFDVAWARSTIRQCRDAGVACFVKQLGARPYRADGDVRDDPILKPLWQDKRLKDRKGGDPAEWPEDLRVREFPEVARA